MFDKGYIGGGDYRTPADSRPYAVWYEMLKRCYTGSKSCYEIVTVCEEWHNFQNFAGWYYTYHQADFHLDKDLRKFGSKVYSPDTCSFVPCEVNGFAPRLPKERKYTTGVNKKRRAFTASSFKEGAQHYIGRYTSEDEAYNAYCMYKKCVAKQLALKWVDYLHTEVYNNLQISTTQHTMTRENKRSSYTDEV